MRFWFLTLCVMAMVQTVPLALAQQGSKFTPFADVSVTSVVTQIRAANSARITLTCTNNDSSTAIRIGDSTVSISRGQRVPAGGSFSVTATPAIFGFSEGGPVTISCTEEIR